MPSFSQKSVDRLKTCKTDLQRLFYEVVKHFDCTILEGYRDEEKQTKAYQEGRSKVKYPHSRHNILPSDAVDVVPYPVDWTDINRFYEFAGFVKATAIHMGIEVEWGGDFKSFFDGPHWQLKRNV